MTISRAQVTGSYYLQVVDADGETRTPKVSPPLEPKSSASASSATSAGVWD
jgi:hypothetical protein